MKVFPYAQAPALADFYATIKKYDLAKLWRADQIQIEGSSEKVPFPELPTLSYLDWKNAFTKLNPLL